MESNKAAVYFAVVPDEVLSRKHITDNSIAAEFNKSPTSGINGDAEPYVAEKLFVGKSRQPNEKEKEAVGDSSTSEEALDSGLLNTKSLLVFGLLCATNFTFAMSHAIVSPFFPPLALQKGGSMTLVGLVVSSPYIMSFFASPLVGLNMERIGARFLIVSGPFVVSLGTILFGTLAWAPAGAWFFILSVATRLFLGAGATAYYVTSIALQPIVFGNNRFGSVFAFLRSISVAGSIAGPALGGVLFSLYGYPLPFWVCGAAIFLAAIALAVTLPDLDNVFRQHRAKQLQEQEKPSKLDELRKSASLPSNNVTKQASIESFFKSQSMLFCFFVNASVGGTITFYFTSISLQILPLVGTLPRVSYIMLISGVVEAICGPLAGAMQDRFLSPKLSIIFCYVFCSLAFILIGPTPVLPFLHKSLTLTVTGIALFGCGCAFGFTAPFKLANLQATKLGYANNQHTHSIIAGCMISFSTLGGLSGPLIGGVLQDALGYRWASTLFTTFLLAVAFLTLLSFMCEWISSSKTLWTRVERDLKK